MSKAKAVSNSHNSMRSAFRDLLPEQRTAIQVAFARMGVGTDNPIGDTEYAGWSIYRMPSTGKRPTTVRLHYRNSNGKLQQVVHITENGVTAPHYLGQ